MTFTTPAIAFYDAGNSIGTVLRRRTIAQYLDTLDGCRRDHGIVDRVGAGIDRTERRELQVDQCRAMPARAVDQHQRLVTGRITAVPSAIGKRCVFRDGAIFVNASVTSNVD
jgi:hypothetical protein